MKRLIDLLEQGIILVVLSCFLPFSALADDQSDKNTINLDPVVVTATRTETVVTNAPGSISVVTKEDIEDRNIESIDEALDTTVGIFHDTKGKGLMGTTSSITMRGFSYDKRILFMLDGIPLNDSYSGGVGYQLLPVDNVEQIEVVKGVGSSLYGGSAMGGVVNVISRMPEKREINIKAGYGSSFDRGTALDDLSKLYISYRIFTFSG